MGDIIYRIRSCDTGDFNLVRDNKKRLAAMEEKGVNYGRIY